MKVKVLCEPQNARMQGAVALTSALAESSCSGPISDSVTPYLFSFSLFLPSIPGSQSTPVQIHMTCEEPGAYNL